MAETGITRELARFIVQTKPQDLPLYAIKKAKDCFLDWLGCAFIGSRSESARMFLELVQEQGGNRESTIIGHEMTSCLNAALVNGAISHEMEFDDVHKASISHPGAAVIPAALAIAEREHASGMTFLASIVLGYDVATRIGEAVGPSHYKYWHTTGTCGTFGAAAAAGKVLELDRDGMLNALGNAGTQAAGLWEFITDGAMTKVLHPAKAATNGLLSALLAKKGFTGATKILEGERGFCKASSSEYDLQRIIRGLGKDYKILEVSFKPYPCCRHTHSTIKAALDLIREHALDYPDVRSVRVEIYSTAIEIAGILQPKTPREAKFSLPYCLAVALKCQKVGLDEFVYSRLEDEGIRKLMNKVQLTVNPALDAAYPGMWPTIIEIETKQGQLLRKRVDFPPGDPENPLAKGELKDKFRQLAGSVIKERNIESIIEMIERLEMVRDMSKLTEALREASAE